jgi:hypothetical protein
MLATARNIKRLEKNLTKADADSRDPCGRTLLHVRSSSRESRLISHYVFPDCLFYELARACQTSAKFGSEYCLQITRWTHSSSRCLVNFALIVLFATHWFDSQYGHADIAKIILQTAAEKVQGVSEYQFDNFSQAKQAAAQETKEKPLTELEKKIAAKVKQPETFNIDVEVRRFHCCHGTMFLA